MKKTFKASHVLRMCLITNISHGSVPVSVGNGTPREGRELVLVMKFPKSH